MPEGFTLDIIEGLRHHEGKYMGDYGFGWVDLEMFCYASLPEIEFGDNYSVEKTGNGYQVTFNDPWEADEYSTIRCLQTAFKFMYGTPTEPYTITCNGQQETFDNSSVADYRIVYGFDS